MSKSWDSVVGLGSNMGDRLGNLRAALSALGAVAPVVRVSPVYETKPMGPPQPDYLNAAVRLSAHLPPDALLTECQRVERLLGRERSERWGPRTLDLDILWVMQHQVRSTLLTIPHPGLRSRTFALFPLLDVAPDATDPSTGVRYAEMATPGRRPPQAHPAHLLWPG